MSLLGQNQITNQNESRPQQRQQTPRQSHNHQRQINSHDERSTAQVRQASKNRLHKRRNVGEEKSENRPAGNREREKRQRSLINFLGKTAYLTPRETKVHIPSYIHSRIRIAWPLGLHRGFAPSQHRSSLPSLSPGPWGRKFPASIRRSLEPVERIRLMLSRPKPVSCGY